MKLFATLLVGASFAASAALAGGPVTVKEDPILVPIAPVSSVGALPLLAIAGAVVVVAAVASGGDSDSASTHPETN
jgi:hypothetical protein